MENISSELFKVAKSLFEEGVVKPNYALENNLELNELLTSGKDYDIHDIKKCLKDDEILAFNGHNGWRYISKDSDKYYLLALLPFDSFSTGGLWIIGKYEFEFNYFEDIYTDGEQKAIIATLKNIIDRLNSMKVIYYEEKDN